MAPQSAWNKKPQQNQNVHKTAAAQDRAAHPAIDYGTVQLEEVEALQAIFMEDFEEVETRNAWSKTTDRSFKLKLASFSDAESFVVLSVQLTATYPKTVPVLDVSGLDAFHERTQKRIRNVLQIRPKQLLGEVMIHVIATEIQEALEDAVQARQSGTLPSLEDERASAEEVATALAKQAEADETRRLEEAQAEEQRTLKQMVDEEIHRRGKRKISRPHNHAAEPQTSPQGEVVVFEQPSVIKVGKEDAQFTSVTIVSRNQDCLVGKPSVGAVTTVPLVAIKRYSYQAGSRAELADLEATLEVARTIRHINISNLYSFRIEKDENGPKVTLCTELAPRGSLQDLLGLCGQLQDDKARQFSIQLLEGLEECHRHGIAHGAISANTILLSGSSSVVPKLSEVGYGKILAPKEDLPARWQPPETADKSSNAILRKSDIWRLGVVVLQMFLGLDITTTSSPLAICDQYPLSESFDELVRRMCSNDARKRPSAFDLLPAEFLRTAGPALERDNTQLHLSDAGRRGPLQRRLRHGSSNMMEPMSRYAQDFTELGRLGKGGFGEVVKARNKLDGGIYAVKKISRAPQLDQILSEVMLLNRINHPYVVRYYSTWVEEISQADSEDATTTTDGTITDDLAIDFGFPSTGGLDFVSSSGYPQIKFGDDSESDESSDDSVPGDAVRDANSSSDVDSQYSDRLPLKKSRSNSRKVQSTLYIQMEYCERHTLRDLVRRGMSEDDSWRFIRQITEGLAQIHAHGIIHRDLKPDNIFIDVAGNPKIGDFGLATTGQYQVPDGKQAFSGQASVDMTRSVGTAMYVAPELSSGSGISYNDKVDMYSLGIIFYEMCQHFDTAMERIRALQDLRKKDHELPQAYQHSGNKSAQGKVITCLVSHKPSERPSSTELLRTGMLPFKIEDETIRQALSSLSDSRSPYHQKMMSALFAHDQSGEGRVKSLAWEAKSQMPFDDPMKLRLRTLAKDAITAVFRRHGAEEISRENIFPRSSHYSAPNVVQLLDASGNLLQLPYDLTLPQARRLARHALRTRCTYTVGNVYRDTFTGGPPSANEEVDFDIVCDSSSDTLALDDAEIVKVLDEIMNDSSLSGGSGTVCFHLNHTLLLDAILDFCHVPTAQQQAVKECVSKLGYRQFTWSKIRSELRSHSLGLSSTTVDDLEQFDFREVPEKTFTRLREMFQGASPRLFDKLDRAVRHLQDVLQNTSQFSVTRKIWISPLGSFNAKFFEAGILVQCVHDRKTSRDVLAAGGRYNSLIQACRTSTSTTATQGAVGVSIGLDRLVANMLKNAKATAKGTFARNETRQESTAKRCEVALMSGMSSSLQIANMKLLTSLWDGHISAELASDERNLDEEQYEFIVALRHAASNTVKVRGTGEDAAETDVPVVSLVNYLQHELREKEGTRRRLFLPGRHPSQAEVDHKSSVQVLMAQHRSKKSNKYHIVETARQKWSEKLDQWKEAPILAVETRDDVIELVRDTRLGDAESWRKAIHSIQPNERQYVQQIQDILSSWRKKWAEGDASRETCLFNFRTGHVIYYDLGL